MSSNLFSFFPPFTKINHSSFQEESCRNKFSKIQIGKIMSEKKNPKMIQIHAFKKKEKEGGTTKNFGFCNCRMQLQICAVA